MRACLALIVLTCQGPGRRWVLGSRFEGLGLKSGVQGCVVVDFQGLRLWSLGLRVFGFGPY